MIKAGIAMFIIPMELHLGGRGKVALKDDQVNSPSYGKIQTLRLE